MTQAPVRLRRRGDGAALVVSDAGRFAEASPAFIERWYEHALMPADERALRANGLLVDEDDALANVAHLRGIAERLVRAGPLDYMILVPTLRCNLSCSYCQVSRATETAPGHDWNDSTLGAVLGLIDTLTTSRIKIEFQGGEPTLRPDLINAVIERCARFAHAEFVICTNLQRLSDEVLAILDRPNVYISTSLDGDTLTHSRNRTNSAHATAEFTANLRHVFDRYGPAKVSALPTVDPASPPDVDALIDAYASVGLDSIYLRPINYQGFARKRHSGSREQDDAWRGYYERFVDAIIARNWRDRSRVLEETYLSVVLRRIFRPGAERHVDLRNPNPMGHDYIVIDHDGVIYPTDEARMLARSGVIDLAIGDVHEGWAGARRDLLNAHATNQFDPDCRRCAYQPFCGRDVVDDLARYGRIDVPRRETAFCRRHLHLFDLAFDLIYSADDAVRYSLARWLRLPGTPTRFGEVIA